MQSTEAIGLDLGGKKTGIARGNMVAKLAQPLKSVDTELVADAIKELQEHTAIAAIVVGLPRNLSGEDTAQTQWVRDWVTKTKDQFGIPFYWQDESLTTVQAQSQLKPNRGDEHSLAAAVILQDFLDSSEAERVLC